MYPTKATRFRPSLAHDREAGACPVALWKQVDESLWLEMLRYGHNEQTTHFQKSIVL